MLDSGAQTCLQLPEGDKHILAKAVADTRMCRESNLIGVVVMDVKRVSAVFAAGRAAFGTATN